MNWQAASWCAAEDTRLAETVGRAQAAGSDSQDGGHKTLTAKIVMIEIFLGSSVLQGPGAALKGLKDFLKLKSDLGKSNTTFTIHQ